MISLIDSLYRQTAGANAARTLCRKKYMAMDIQFWDGSRWDGHRAFNTVNHEHISCYSAAPGHKDCELMIVECADGRWYVEDSWGADAQGAEKVWNPRDPSNEGPNFFSS